MFGLFVICVTVIFGIEGSGFVLSMKRKIWRWCYRGMPYRDTFSLRPFDCVLCATFWAGAIYLTIIGWSWSRLLALVLLSWNADIIYSIIRLVRDTVTILMNRVYDRIDR